MGKQVRVWVDESMTNVLERIKSEVVTSLKKQYNIEEIEINGNIISKIAAARLKGNTLFNFKIRKCGRNKGILELL
jgi:hypothetical protein